MSDVPTYEVILTDTPGTEAKAVIGDALAAHNTGHAGVDDRRDLSVLVKDTRTAEILRGIIGHAVGTAMKVGGIRGGSAFAVFKYGWT